MTSYSRYTLYRCVCVCVCMQCAFSVLSYIAVSLIAVESGATRSVVLVGCEVLLEAGLSCVFKLYQYNLENIKILYLICWCTNVFILLFDVRSLLQLLDYYQACVTYYHQGFDLCNDFDEFFKNISEDLNVLRGDYQQLEKVMQNRHMSVNRYCDSNTNSSSHNVEGYLFKKKSKGFKTWCRRWFYLSDNQLVYRWVHSMLVCICMF